MHGTGRVKLSPLDDEICFVKSEFFYRRSIDILKNFLRDFLFRIPIDIHIGVFFHKAAWRNYE